MATNLFKQIHCHLRIGWPFKKSLAVFLVGSTTTMWAAGAACRAAVVNGLMVTTVDTPLKYDATGPVNTSNAWSNNPPASVDNAWYAVPGLAPAPAGGANWNFEVKHSAQFKSNQATDARLYVRGNHIQVPIPNHFEPLNALPEIGTDAITIPVNKSANVSTWGGLEHLVHNPPHFDFYGVVGTKMKYTVLGATGTLGGKVDVIGRHSDNVPKEFQNWRIDSTLASSGMQYRPGGSTVSFDASTNMLTFNTAPIDVLDMQGGLSHGIDPQFAADSLVGAHLSVSPLMLQGLDPDGRFRFSGGNVQVMGQTNQVGMRASFDEYLVGDTSEQQTLNSFGVLRSGSTHELPNTEQTTPTFLQTFADDQLLQHGPAQGSFSDRALTFSFVTAPGLNLAQLTNGFTMSAMFVPADIVLGGTGFNGPTDTAGDYNHDGVVNVLDYQAWRSDFGNPQSLADGNGDGLTDAADYVMWRANVGNATTVSHFGQLSASSIVVPEPSVAVLALAGLCLMSTRRRRGSATCANFIKRLGAMKC